MKKKWLLNRWLWRIASDHTRTDSGTKFVYRVFQICVYGGWLGMIFLFCLLSIEALIK